jgi:hypothetical protein
MLAVPLPLPLFPLATGISMGQNFSYGISFEGAMAVTKVNIGESQGGNRLMAMGTDNFCAKYGILRIKSGHIPELSKWVQDSHK